VSFSGFRTACIATTHIGFHRYAPLKKSSLTFRDILSTGETGA